MVSTIEFRTNHKFLMSLNRPDFKLKYLMMVKINLKFKEKLRFRKETMYATQLMGVGSLAQEIDSITKNKMRRK
jgi:hypothetical protein